MKVPIQVNDLTREASLEYLQQSDFAFLNQWRNSLADDTNPIRTDAVNFANLACKRFTAHSPFENYARDIDEIGDHIKDNPYCEVANLVGLTGDCFPPSKVLGLVHFRRTWSNNLVLDYLAVHPLIARPPQNSRGNIRGVGTAMLFFVSWVARRYGCGSIWGEATQNSCEFYQKIFNLDAVGDLLYIPHQNYTDFLANLEQKWEQDRR